MIEVHYTLKWWSCDCVKTDAGKIHPGLRINLRMCCPYKDKVFTALTSLKACDQFGIFNTRASDSFTHEEGGILEPQVHKKGEKESDIFQNA